MKARLIEFWVLLSSDKRKASVLGVLLVAALGLWARMALTGAKPSSAVAAGSAAGDSADVAGDDRRDPTEGFEVAPLVTLPATTPLERDLFVPGPGFGPRPSQTEHPDTTDPKSGQGSDDKSPVSPELRRQELERAVRNEASHLYLSSTMVGSNPVAVIQQEGANGVRAVLRLGESFEGFELVEVSPRSAVLSKDGIRVELSIGRR
ncbi:MAG: hypothetical protein H6814_11690 [Phycisphaeraceae bacterium]|nr:hypothetical protein [Phycisphaeraceae bacterium]